MTDGHIMNIYNGIYVSIEVFKQKYNETFAKHLYLIGDNNIAIEFCAYERYFILEILDSKEIDNGSYYDSKQIKVSDITHVFIPYASKCSLYGNSTGMDCVGTFFKSKDIKKIHEYFSKYFDDNEYEIGTFVYCHMN